MRSGGLLSFLSWLCRAAVVCRSAARVKQQGSLHFLLRIGSSILLLSVQRLCCFALLSETCRGSWQSASRRPDRAA